MQRSGYTELSDPEWFSRAARLYAGRLLVSFIVAVFAVSPAAASTAADSVQKSAISLPDSAGHDSLAARADSLGIYSGTTNLKQFDFSSDSKSHTEIGWVGVIASILIVIGLLYLFLYLMRRYFYRPGGALGVSGQFELLQQFHLGPKKNLTLIKVGERILLLGVTDNAINTLMEIRDEVELQRIQAGMKDRSGPRVRDFREIYQGLVGRIRH